MLPGGKNGRIRHFLILPCCVEGKRGPYNAKAGFVQIFLRDLSAGDGLADFLLLVVLPDMHFHIAAAGDAALSALYAPEEIADDKAVKIPVTLQNLSQQIGIVAAFCPLIEIVGVHDGGTAAFYKFAEVGKINLLLGALVCGHADLEAGALHGIEGKMLAAGDHVFTLNALHQRSSHFAHNETEDARIFVEFVTLIVRNRIYHQLIEQEKKNDKKENYMTVPAAIRELEKIEIIQQSDHRYRLNYAVTATQKEILKAFGINEINIKKWANEISDKLSEKMKEAV